MDILELIKTRRSIRKYKPDMISDEHVDMIIEAGLYAPSTKNKQDRRIIVFNGLDKVNNLNSMIKEAALEPVIPEGNPQRDEEKVEYCEKVLKDSYSINFGAPFFVICTSDSTKGNPEADCALMLQNMFLMAHSLGIGSVWINQFKYMADTKVFRDFFRKNGVPDTHKIYGTAAFGYNSGLHPKIIDRKDGQVIMAEF